MINIGPLLPSTNTTNIAQKKGSVNASDKADASAAPTTLTYERRKGRDRRQKKRRTLLDSRAGKDRRQQSRKGRSIDIEA